MLKTILAAVAASAFLIGSVHAGADKAAAESAISAAKEAVKKASSVNGEWRDTGKMIKKAEAALEKGEFDKAVKSANDAEFQGNMGYEQAVSQQGVGNPDYL